MALPSTIQEARPVAVHEALEALARPGPGGRRALAGRDASFAERLMRIGATCWEPRTTYAAWQLMRGHQRALLERDIDFNAIEPPPAVQDATGEVRYVYRRENTLVLSFTFDPALHGAARAFPEIHYDAIAREYEFPPTPENVDALRDLLRQHPRFTVTAGARLLLRSAGDRRFTPQRQLRFDGGTWRLSLPRPATTADWRTVAHLARIPAACYHDSLTAGDLPEWTIDPAGPGTLARLAALVEPGSPVVISPRDRALLPAEGSDATPAALDGGGAIDFTGRTFKLTFPPRPPLLEAVRALDGARFERQHSRWSAARTTGNASSLRALATGLQFDLTAAAAAEIARLEGVLADRAAAATQSSADAARTVAAAAALNLPLRPFQVAAVTAILNRKRLLLGDEPGLGKTLDALAAVQLAGAYPALVVAPATLKLTWRVEARTWLPDLRVAVLNGTKANAAAVADADLIIVNYEIAHAWRDVLTECRPRALLVDESHYLANSSARRTRVVTELGDAIAEDGLIVAISATALVNCPRELIPQLVLLRHIKEFGGVNAFKQRYCGLTQDSAKRWDDSGSTNLGELHARLRDGCLVRRRKEDVLDELPAKLPPARVVVEITNRRAYAKLTRDVVAQLLADTARVRATSAASRDGATATATAAAGRAAAARARSAAALVLLNQLRSLASAGKVKAACAWITTFLQSGQKLVVFADVTPTQRALVEAFADAEHILADDSPAARQRAVERFQADPNCRLIICSLRVAGTGITLHAASDVLLVDLPWHAAAVTQAIDRVHRIGQHHPVTPWFLLAADTVDVDIAAVIARKAAIAGEALDGDPAAGGDEATAATVCSIADHLIASAGQGTRRVAPAAGQLAAAGACATTGQQQPLPGQEQSWAA